MELLGSYHGNTLDRSEAAGGRIVVAAAVGLVEIDEKTYLVVIGSVVVVGCVVRDLTAHGRIPEEKLLGSADWYNRR